MADGRARSEQSSASSDAATGAGSAGEASGNGAGRTTSESQVVARSLLEPRPLGQHLQQLERLALAADPVPSVPHVAAELERGPPSVPPPEEFLRLFNEYERYVASIGSRILGANNGVDDLVQEVFLVIYQEFHKLRELSSIKAWLATIATRVAWRQRGRPWLYSKLSLTQVEELNPLESTDASPELQADLATLLERLRSMPASLREPWLLRFIDGETLPRIAELLDCSQSTVQRRLREAGEVMLGEKLPT
jgi:RNA polymerase sigma factor (sigma-70 family)